MRIKDPVAWSQHEQWFDEDEIRRRFREHLVFWLDTAETMMAEDGLSAYAAMQDALWVTEEEIGQLNLEAYGQALMFVSQYWEYGSEVVEAMTKLELKTLAAATQDWIDQLQQHAAEDGGESVGGSG